MTVILQPQVLNERFNLLRVDESSNLDTLLFKSISKEQVRMTCPFVQLTHEWIRSQNWPPSIFDNKIDRCYCENCYLLNWKDVELVDECKYVIPRGWVIRVVLHVDQKLAGIHQIWSDWIVCYHDTSKMAALSILSHHHFYLSGDKLMDGTVLGIHDGHILDKKHTYTSPTIAYSSLPAYSPKYNFHSTMTRKDYHVQPVLQCRQKPGTFYIQEETVEHSIQRSCPYIPSNIIEDCTDIRSSIVVYGLSVHIVE